MSYRSQATQEDPKSNLAREMLRLSNSPAPEPEVTEKDTLWMYNHIKTKIYNLAAFEKEKVFDTYFSTLREMKCDSDKLFESLRKDGFEISTKNNRIIISWENA